MTAKFSGPGLTTFGPLEVRLAENGHEEDDWICLTGIRNIAGGENAQVGDFFRFEAWVDVLPPFEVWVDVLPSETGKKFSHYFRTEVEEFSIPERWPLAAPKQSLFIRCWKVDEVIKTKPKVEPIIVTVDSKANFHTIYANGLEMFALKFYKGAWMADTYKARRLARRLGQPVWADKYGRTTTFETRVKKIYPDGTSEDYSYSE
jgi:hypothetical protein